MEHRYDSYSLVPDQQRGKDSTIIKKKCITITHGRRQSLSLYTDYLFFPKITTFERATEHISLQTGE